MKGEKQKRPAFFTASGNLICLLLVTFRSEDERGIIALGLGILLNIEIQRVSLAQPALGGGNCHPLIENPT
jgi:hypothetical protein